MTEANTQLSPTQRTVLLKLHSAGEHSIAGLAELFLHQSPHRLPRDRTNARQQVRCRRSLSDPSGGGPQGCFGDKPEEVMRSFASDHEPREGAWLWCRWWVSGRLGRS
jgi:hypothetical protein